MQYYERIMVIRKRKKITQQEVADALEIKRSQYARYESGQNEMPVKHLAGICRTIGVSADYILGLTEDEQNGQN